MVMAVQGHMRRSDQVAVQYSFAPVEVCAMNEKLPWRNIIGYSLGDVANNVSCGEVEIMWSAICHVFSCSGHKSKVLA